MKCMERNKSVFWYSTYKDKQYVVDEYGNNTGEFEIIRNNPKRYKANISSAKGESETQVFGANEIYDKTIVLDDTKTDIDIYTVLWVDIMPELNEDGSLAVDENSEIVTPYDYQVKKVAKSLNSVTLAISKVNVK